MKKFPSKLLPENISLFDSYNTTRIIRYLRRRIYEWMISDDFVTRCFDLQLSQGQLQTSQGQLQTSQGQLQTSQYPSHVIDSISKELNLLGWKTKIAFAYSSLYIYKEDDENPCKWDFEEL